MMLQVLPELKASTEYYTGKFPFHSSSSKENALASIPAEMEGVSPSILNNK